MPSNRLQNTINYQGGLAQNTLNNLRTNTGNQNATFWNNYMTGAGQNLGSYDEIMGNYRNFAQGQNAINAPNQGRINEALGGYSNFAQTGGFSPQDIQN